MKAEPGWQNPLGFHVVNTVRYLKYGDSHYAAIGLDRTGKDGVLCGIALIKINSASGDRVSFVVDETKSIANITPYKVNGISVNSIAWPSNSTVLFTAAGGNDALVDMAENGIAGFAKWGIFTDEEGQVKLTQLAVKEGFYYVDYNSPDFQ